MVLLITGGSGSGKSAFAETQLLELCKNSIPMYYLATMQIYGAEGLRKVERHHRLRAGKGFATIEQPRDISGCLSGMGAESGALLECMSNLTANEMFTPEGIREEDAVVDKICREVEALMEQLTHLVIVTNNVFEDGISYDKETMAYIRALGRINQRLAARADRVWEVVAGIPIDLKEDQG